MLMSAFVNHSFSDILRYQMFKHQSSELDLTKNRNHKSQCKTKNMICISVIMLKNSDELFVQ